MSESLPGDTPPLQFPADWESQNSAAAANKGGDSSGVPGADTGELLRPEAQRARDQRDRVQHMLVLTQIMPEMPDTATRDLNRMHAWLEVDQERNLHSLFHHAIQWKAQARSKLAANNSNEEARDSLPLLYGLCERLILVTKLARMQEFAEPDEKAELQERIQNSEVLPSEEKRFWFAWTNTLLQEGGTDRWAPTGTVGAIALTGVN